MFRCFIFSITKMKHPVIILFVGLATVLVAVEACGRDGTSQGVGWAWGRNVDANNDVLIAGKREEMDITIDAELGNCLKVLAL